MQLSDREYDKLCQLVYDCTRIHLGPNKKELMLSRLSGYLKQKGLNSFSEYIDFLENGGLEEQGRLIDCITTNHTFFFREQAHFDFLSESILPSITKTEKKKHLKIWSAACSSGEEPYSLAITLSEKLDGSLASWEVDASDISEAVLQKAREGVYREDRLKEVPKKLKEKYFLQGIDAWSGYFRVRDGLRKNIRFLKANLLDNLSLPDTQFDIIFCRNVMIYFDGVTQEALVQNLLERMLPGAFLVVGHSENLSGFKHSLKVLSPSIYQKK